MIYTKSQTEWLLKFIDENPWFELGQYVGFNDQPGLHPNNKPGAGKCALS